MGTAVIYARISKDEAGDHLGVERQEKRCRTLAAERGLIVTDVFVDNDVSAYSRKPRPQFERLVELLKDGDVSDVITYHVDRLYRRATDLERLVDVIEVSGAHVHTCAAGELDLSSASGQLVARIVGATAQHESARMGERIRMKHDELAASGRPPGGRAPYGYAWGYEPDPATGAMRRNYVVHDAEATAVRRMAERVLEGASALAIARELDAAGISTREGRPWHSSSVRASLVNPAVAGVRVHRREIAGTGSWPAILQRSLWEEVRAVLADPSRRRTRPARKYLLSGLVTTAKGEPMTGAPDTKNRERRIYRALTNGALSIGADELEDWVVKAVLSVLDDAPLPPRDQTTEAGAVEVIERELEELATLRGAGTISLPEWLAARAPLQERLAAARKDAGRARRTSKAARMISAPGEARRRWPDLDFATRREVIESVLLGIEVAPATRGRWTPIAERLTPQLRERS
jgi:DNA invertase Pin-like site-specific DNA recombinase